MSLNCEASTLSIAYMSHQGWRVLVHFRLRALKKGTSSKLLAGCAKVSGA